MTRHTVKLALMATFFVMLVGLILQSNINRPRILVLHSYHPGYPWTMMVEEGLHRELDRHSWIQVRHHFMDTKRRSNAEHLRRAGAAARAAIEKIDPDVVIAVDDYAQLLAARHYVNHPDINIVFAGVNGGVQKYGYEGAQNVTGIFERKPVVAIHETVELLMLAAGRKVRDRTTKVALLSDATLSSGLDADHLARADWAMLNYTGHRRVTDFEAWKAEVRALSASADFILIAGYRKLKTHPDADPRDPFVPAAEVMRWTERHATVPAIGINVYSTGDGAMLSIGPSGYHQGSTAAIMAEKIIEGGIQPRDIPFETSLQYLVSYRASALKRHKFAVPAVFEARARATGNYRD
jgi:hypothetical protein